jgi:hypothetical protein
MIRGKRRQGYKAGEATEVLWDEILNVDMPVCLTLEPFNPWKSNTYCTGEGGESTTATSLMGFDTHKGIVQAWVGHFDFVTPLERR